MEQNTVMSILLFVSFLLTLTICVYISFMRKKKQIHYAFIGMTVGLSIWNLAVFLILISNGNLKYESILNKMLFFGITFVPISLLYFGMIYAKTHIAFTRKHVLLFIPPIFTLLMLFTNDFHHLFYVKNSLIPSENQRGIYFMINTIYSYIYIAIGLWYLAYSSVKNSGFFSRQSILISLGMFVPFIFDICSSFGVVNWSAAFENVAFSFSMICFALAILKFGLFNVMPVALQRIVDLISDSYVVLNEDYEIIDYNKTFTDTFSIIINFKRRDNLIDIIKSNEFGIGDNELIEYINTAINENKTVSFEKSIVLDGSEYFFSIEIICMFSHKQHIATIILFKDITEHKKNIEYVIQLNEKLKEMANKDGLTQAYNRYFFDERLRQEIDRVLKQLTYGGETNRNSEDFGLIIFDIDFFKHYNDNNGHLAGDMLLKEIVNVVRYPLFQTDILCRYGGEEFAIICCKTPPERVAIVAKKVRATVENHIFKFQESQPNGNLTISVGLSCCPNDGLTNEKLIKKADERLYIAKHQGRNRVIFQESETANK